MSNDNPLDVIPAVTPEIGAFPGPMPRAGPSRLRNDRGFAPILRDVARYCRGGALDPEDVAQEAWLAFIACAEVARAGDKGGGDENPAWVVAAIRNHLTDMGRRAARRLCRPLTQDGADCLVGREENPSEAFERSQDRAEVRAVLEEARGRISGPTHRIAVLRWVEGLTFAEIAEVLGMPVARVRDRHRRAFPVLRALLTRRFEGDSAGPMTIPVDVSQVPGLEEVTP